MSTTNANTRWWTGIAGTDNGTFFRCTPSWVDKSKAPGHTSQSISVSNNPKWTELITSLFTASGILYSPNLIWFVITLAVYVIFPYDYDATRELNWTFFQWFVRRMVLNVTVVFLYYGFWHMTLYWFHWSDRPFNPKRTYRWSKVLHNIYYTLLGTVQWTMWESVMVYCYATGRMPYKTDAEALSTVRDIGELLLWITAVPIYREVQFYFAHRLIHIKCLYRFVHSVHHRNTDIEPFSGLCMHPIEHLYYFTSIGPSLYFKASPLAFLWNGIHLILSPGASHSGYEDHWSSDQFHYLHHRYFECNYGTPSFMLDRTFGTFRDSLVTSSVRYYRGPHVEGKTSATSTAAASSSGGGGTGNDNDVQREKVQEEHGGDVVKLDAQTSAALDGKATLCGLPDWDQLVFNVVFCMMTPMLFLAVLLFQGNGGEGFDKTDIENPTTMTNTTPLDPTSSVVRWLSDEPNVVASIVTLGPIIGSFVMSLLVSSLASFGTSAWSKANGGLWKMLTYPFHREKFIPTFSLHVVIGFLVGVMPVYQLIHMALADAGDGAYFVVRKMVVAL